MVSGCAESSIPLEGTNKHSFHAVLKMNLEFFSSSNMQNDLMEVMELVLVRWLVCGTHSWYRRYLEYVVGQDQYLEIMQISSMWLHAVMTLEISMSLQYCIRKQSLRMMKALWVVVESIVIQNWVVEASGPLKWCVIICMNLKNQVMSWGIDSRVFQKLTVIATFPSTIFICISPIQQKRCLREHRHLSTELTTRETFVFW